MIKCLLIVVLVLTATSSSMDGSEIAKPSCPDECGVVEIPFPFGIGHPDCYLNNTHYMSDYNLSYRIACDHTTNPPTPFILDRFESYHKLLSINVDNHTLRVSSKVAYECYTINNTNNNNLNNNAYNIPSIWPFNISSRNRFVAVGCDTTAKVRDYDQSGRGAVGCITSCPSTVKYMVRNRPCDGSGCCQTSILYMEKPSILVGSLSNHSQVVEFNPCSYAFVGELGSYEFSKANLTLSAKDLDEIRVPVAYRWSVVFSVNCSEAMKAGNGSLLCGSNTRCVDGIGPGWGYRCQCLEGYTGNPYLSTGCQDINECSDERVLSE